MSIFKLHEDWDFPCSKSQNSICVDVGQHKCKIHGTYGGTKQTEVFTGKRYVDALWASTLHVDPFANDGFAADQKQVIFRVGPESHNVIFTFAESPDAEKPAEFDDGADTGEPSQLDRIEYQMNENTRMLRALLSSYSN